jgi:hypothetical protein
MTSPTVAERLSELGWNGTAWVATPELVTTCGYCVEDVGVGATVALRTITGATMSAQVLEIPLHLSGVMLPGGETSDVLPTPANPPLTIPSPQRVLDEPLQGQAAIDALGDKLVLVVEQNALTIVETVTLLADPTVRVGVTGQIFFVENPSDPVSAALDPISPSPGPFPYEQTFLLHSKPGSQRTIYLDFDGHTVTGTAWNDSFGEDPINALPFDSDGNPGSFANAELDAIQSIWQRVAEDYAPFDVDVTTEDPGYAAISRSSVGDAEYGTRLVITSRPSNVCSGAPGCAFLGNFDSIGATHDYLQPGGWVFSSGIANVDTKNVAEVTSHEIGHNAGLFHDGVGAGHGPNTYYAGHNVWAPIMGVGYNMPIVQFSKGEYSNPSNTEDDFVVMASNGLAERADDHTNSPGTATELASSQTGIISSENDFDAFRYSAAASGLVTFSAQPSSVSPNLDIVLALFSSDMTTLLETSTPAVVGVSRDVALGMDAEITYQATAGETYFVRVSGGSHGTDGTSGYTRYGSIGQFTISVDIAGNLVPTVSAGEDQTIAFPNSANLSGTIGDDGQPDPLSTVTTTWSKVTGPGIVTFGDVSVLNTTASFSTDGVYVLRLTASDDVLQNSDDVTVTVDVETTNTFVDDDGHLFEKAIEWLAAEGITKGCNSPVNNKYCPDDFVTRGQMAVFLVRAMGYTDSGDGNLFIDDDGLFYENAANKLFTAGVTVGCNPPINDKYCGNDFVTRGQMAVFLVRAMGYTDNGGGNLFTDDDGHLFENAIDKLGTAGVTVGCNPPANTHFCPNDFVTRGQMAAFLKRALT